MRVDAFRMPRFASHLTPLLNIALQQRHVDVGGVLADGDVRNGAGEQFDQ